MFFNRWSFGLVLLIFVGSVLAERERMHTAFTYQGELEFQGQPANGEFDFSFEIYDEESDGTSFSSPFVLEDVLVTNGIFTVELDFGDSVFLPDIQRWLSITVREGSSLGDGIVLVPRQKITGSPFVIGNHNVKTYRIPAVTLNSPNFVRHVGFGEAYLKAGTSVAWATAPVHLPSGAYVRAVGCSYKDNDNAGNIRFAFVESSLLGTDRDIRSYTSNIAGASSIRVQKNLVTNEFISNEEYSYYIYVKIAGLQGPDLAVYSCYAEWN
jgi:hypothetical protein